MRGSRAIKMDNSGLDAFTSPNTPPLATTEISIHGLKIFLKLTVYIRNKFTFTL